MAEPMPTQEDALRETPAAAEEVPPAGAEPAPADFEAGAPSAEEEAQVPAPPADAEAAEADSEAPPADSEAPPADSEALPADAEAPPADSEAPPADTEAAAADSEAPPAGAEAPPADTEAPLPEGEATAGEGAPISTETEAPERATSPVAAEGGNDLHRDDAAQVDAAANGGEPAPDAHVSDTTAASSAGPGAEANEGRAAVDESPEATTGLRVPVELIGAKVTPQTVRLMGEGEEVLDEFVVHVYRPIVKKPFLGGFRSKETGLEYHNASSQTYRAVRNTGKVLFHRTTQTQIKRDHDTNDQQTTVETSTQVARPGVIIDTTHDKVLVTGGYETASDRHARIVRAVVIIQKYFRRWSAVREVTAMRKAKADFEEYVARVAERRTAAVEEEHVSQVHRRVNPRTVEDFDLLYSGLEVWRKEQAEGIKGLPQDQQQAAKASLLAQQCKYLNAIDQLKQGADVENRERRIEKFLDKASAPRTFVTSNGQEQMGIETPGNQRARDLRDVYNLIKITTLRSDERLDALTMLKGVVEEFDDRVAREIVDLVHREADLMARGTKQRNLEGLRKRTLNLFLQLLENPEFNPEAGRLLTENKPAAKHAKDTFFCNTTKKFLPAEEFEVSPNVVTGPKKSKKAERMQNRATTRLDNTQYRRVLQSVQAAEKQMEGFSQCIFLMTVSDVRYLIDTVWGCKSALSEEPELFLLEMVRWDPSQEWSPWNCILLNKEEADAHLKLDDPGATYGHFLVSKVKQKHILARNYFKTLVSHLQRARKQAKLERPASELPSYGMTRLRDQQRV